jgi:molybdopterin converting factor subunit 1
MTVTALLFASYADALGRPRVELSLPEGATVREALVQLRGVPGGTSLPDAPLVAVNLSYARGDAVLAAGDELAVIPPVAGG